MDSFWLGVTNLGRDEVFIVILALYTWLVQPAGGRNLGIVFALSYLANSMLKYGLNLPRPFTNNSDVASAAAKATASGPGMPSGHTQMAATLWFGMAWQLKKRWMWILAGVVVLFIAASRVVLHVHSVTDVVVGLLLGCIFAYFAQFNFPQFTWWRWVPVVIALLWAALLPAGTPKEYGTSLGLLAGFWWARPNYYVPKTWPDRIIVAVLGLLMVFAVFFGLGALPESFKNISIVRALRYAILVVVAVEGIPFMLQKWMPKISGSQYL